MGPRTGQDALEMRKILFLYWELNCNYSDVQPTTWSLLITVSWHTRVTLNKIATLVTWVYYVKQKYKMLFILHVYDISRYRYALSNNKWSQLIMKSTESIGSLITSGCCCYLHYYYCDNCYCCFMEASLFKYWPGDWLSWWVLHDFSAPPSKYWDSTLS